jgi:hypothetical protein
MRFLPCYALNGHRFAPAQARDSKRKSPARDTVVGDDGLGGLL